MLTDTAGEIERARLLDVERRLRTARLITGVATLLALVASGPWIGWWPLPAYLLSVGILLLSDRLVSRVERPETVIFTGVVIATVAGAAMIAVSGGLRSPLLILTAVPIVSLGVRFRGRLLYAGIGTSVSSILVACLIADPGAFRADPAPIFVVLATVISVGTIMGTLRRSDVRQRAEAVIDPLTGLFNRSGLRQRFEELSAQARFTDQPIAIILGDIDRFKSINDRFGHAHGDAVLKDVTYRMRKTLRRFELLYRLGGEEFVAVLPGVDLPEAATLAERLRASIAADSSQATMSFGVAVSGRGALSWETLFRIADERLYLAKLGGRNRVVGAAPPESAPGFAEAPG